MSKVKRNIIVIAILAITCTATAFISINLYSNETEHDKLINSVIWDDVKNSDGNAKGTYKYRKIYFYKDGTIDERRDNDWDAKVNFEHHYDMDD